jgi:ATP/maltotriose-dependent transcriptional regulator MalT
VFLARTLWLQGFPDQAKAAAHQTIKDAITTDRPVTLSIALIWSISLVLWMDDVDTAKELLARFVARAELHSIEPYLAAGRAYKGVLAIHEGNAIEGVKALQNALVDLHSARYELLTTKFSISLVQGLTALGRVAEAAALVDNAISDVEESGDVSYMPELLRVKGKVLLAMRESGPDEVEACFIESLTWSRNQGALTSELCTAIDMATWRADHG